MMNRTAITMPETLLREITVRAKKAGISRSRFITEAMRAQLKQSKNGSLLRKLNKVYAHESENDLLVRKAFQRQASKRTEQTW